MLFVSLLNIHMRQQPVHFPNQYTFIFSFFFHFFIFFIFVFLFKFVLLILFWYRFRCCGRLSFRSSFRHRVVVLDPFVRLHAFFAPSPPCLHPLRFVVSTCGPRLGCTYSRPRIKFITHVQFDVFCFGGRCRRGVFASRSARIVPSKRFKMETMSLKFVGLFYLTPRL